MLAAEREEMLPFLITLMYDDILAAGRETRFSLDAHTNTKIWKILWENNASTPKTFKIFN